jgi:hypothetical protein
MYIRIRKGLQRKRIIPRLERLFLTEKDTTKWAGLGIRFGRKALTISIERRFAPPPPPPTVDYMPVISSQVEQLIRQAQHLEGWFYPTRYNERPGLYVDEFDREWTFGKKEGNNVGWYLPTPDTEIVTFSGPFGLPVDDYRSGGEPIAVRWIGEKGR